MVPEASEVVMPDDNQELLRELHTGLALVQQAQSEINRRIGFIEKSLEEEDKAEDQKRGEWVTWVVQTIGQVILVSTLMYIGQNVFGIGVVG